MNVHNNGTNATSEVKVASWMTRRDELRSIITAAQAELEEVEHNAVFKVGEIWADEHGRRRFIYHVGSTIRYIKIQSSGSLCTDSVTVTSFVQFAVTFVRTIPSLIETIQE
jgi:hypothetical protein